MTPKTTREHIISLHGHVTGIEEGYFQPQNQSLETYVHRY